MNDGRGWWMVGDRKSYCDMTTDWDMAPGLWPPSSPAILFFHQLPQVSKHSAGSTATKGTSPDQPLDCLPCSTANPENTVEVCLCQTSVGRGHGKSEPRSVGVLANAHGMTLLLQRTKTPEPQLHLCFADGSSAKVFRSPSGTFCPKARGLCPQHIWEQALCVFAAWPCFSCPQKNMWSEMQPPNN